MHELSIAAAIVEVANRHAAGRRVVRVEVQVGHLRQVVPDSLRFAFELVAQGTALDGAELAIAQVPAVGRCRDCGARSALERFPLCCARCGALDMEVLAGEELLVEALELEEEGEGEGEELVTNERMGHGSHV
ncbi:MAG TPA: hydrogenase maturation nickel metallochaperone HypA [Solirubrobacteraceae bacterium]|jgi:hydrogenase nickel incorporation protein HypA/HybF|nr:hydrogenase maturation nickel metallochaperone HypA [Solirubrobacteraceae bacterium]